MSSEPSSAMIDKMRDALKRAAQSLQAVKEENRRLHNQLDEANTTIMDLQKELGELKKRSSRADEASSPPKRAKSELVTMSEQQVDTASPPPTKRVRAAQARRQTKKSQVSNAVQSWLGPSSLLPSLPSKKPTAAGQAQQNIVAEEKESEPSHSPPDHEQQLQQQETSDERDEQRDDKTVEQPSASIGFFSGITHDQVLGGGSDTSDDEHENERILPVEDTELLNEHAGASGEGLGAVELPRVQNRSQFVGHLLKQLTANNYARVGHHLATDKRAQGVSLFVAELLSYMSDLCQDLPQQYADEIHPFLPHGREQAQVMLSGSWLVTACKDARTLSARDQLIEMTARVLRLVQAISKHSSKGLTFYDSVTGHLTRELLQQCASKNVMGLRPQVHETDENGETEQVVVGDGPAEKHSTQQHDISPATQSPVKVNHVARDSNDAAGSDAESSDDSDEFLDVEVLPGGKNNAGDKEYASAANVASSDMASVFADLDMLSDSESDNDDTEKTSDEVVQTGSNRNGTELRNENTDQQESYQAATLAPKLQQTTLRKERSDWRTALTTMVVYTLHAKRPDQMPDEQLQVLTWDVLKSCTPHLPSGFLYGLALAWPGMREAIDLEISLSGVPSTTPQTVGFCVLACLRQLLSTASRRPRERFWLFRVLGFFAEWSVDEVKLSALMNDLASADESALYTSLISLLKTMIKNATYQPQSIEVASGIFSRRHVQAVLLAPQLTKNVLGDFHKSLMQDANHHAQQISDQFTNQFGAGYQICCRAIGFIPTVQVLEELGVFQWACIHDQLQHLMFKPNISWNYGNGTILINRQIDVGSMSVERWAFDTTELSKLRSIPSGTSQRFCTAAALMLTAIAAWSVAAIDPPQTQQYVRFHELGLELMPSQLIVAESRDRATVPRLSVSTSQPQHDRIEAVLFQSQYIAAVPESADGISVSALYSSRQAASVAIAALLRVRCLIRGYAQRILQLACDYQQHLGLVFNASRHLLFFDDHGAVVRADIADQILQIFRSADLDIEIPRDILNFTSHTISTRAVGHVINLDRRPDRWHRMIKMAKSFHLILYRHAAVDGSKRDANIPDNDVTFAWNSFVNAKFDDKCVASASVTLSPSERACAASHLQLWRDFSAGKLCGLQLGRFESPLTLILEDDAKFRADNFVQQVADILTQLPSNFDICYLGCIIPSNAKRIKWSQQLIVPEYAWQLHAYLLSREGARKLLNHLPVSAPVDNFVAELTMAGALHSFSVKQSLVTQLKVVNQQTARGSIDTDIRHSGRIIGARMMA